MEQIILAIICIALLAAYIYFVLTAPEKSELNARTRYSVADEITNNQI